MNGIDTLIDGLGNNVFYFFLPSGPVAIDYTNHNGIDYEEVLIPWFKG